ncbi:MAG: thiamine pyrophosphate-dependent enzyme [Bacteroidota bacterium]
MTTTSVLQSKLHYRATRKAQVLEDLRLCALSRELSISMRKEVLTGKAKFGIGGAGKELAQIAMAHSFEKGDFWSGYYREQTFMLAKGLLDAESFFAALYGDTQNDRFSGGRQMNNHFSTPLIDADGAWLPHADQYNVLSSLSALAGQIPHALGIALATKKYRENDALDQQKFSREGREVSFCILGDATTSEGVFFEAVNAAGVMQVPMAFIIQDDGYGISVPTKYQTTKGSISTVLEGFRLNEKGEGLDIYTVKGWDYAALCDTFAKGIAKIRETHIPAIFHIQECTQPQGHSTSGSHQRYKSAERLDWEVEFDCLTKFERWIIDQEIASTEETQAALAQGIASAQAGRKAAWQQFNDGFSAPRQQILAIYQDLLQQSEQQAAVQRIVDQLNKNKLARYRELIQSVEQMLFAIREEAWPAKTALQDQLAQLHALGQEKYNTRLYSDSNRSALKVPVVPAQYDEEAPLKNGFEILNRYFDLAFAKHPNLYAFGEDVGKIGDVNQGFAGLQEKYGENRVFDTGIREWTIVGQAIGMAMRGLRPIGEIQYLDYLAYAFPVLSDNLATLRYRSNGTQMAPAIIRTRGHRLEGIWHSGSPMGMMLHSMRGIYLLVPRNMTQAAGMYNTLLQSDDPAIMVECLNGYRLKEKLPNNLENFTVSLGTPEVLQSGEDVTLVTYGSSVRLAQAAMERLAIRGISVELIDVQTLLPFDLEHRIVESLKKTNRIVFLDEDVPGGATAYMLQEVLEKQGGYRYLDAAPVTITAKAHRPAYADDGDYFSKPNLEEIDRKIVQLMQE